MTHDEGLQKPTLPRAPLFLMTESERNWEAVDGSQKGGEKKHFFINICHRVLQEGQARGCDEEAAVCAVGESSLWAHPGRPAMVCREVDCPAVGGSRFCPGSTWREWQRGCF